MFESWKRWAARAAKERPRAFDFIEFILYILATGSFAWKLGVAALEPLNTSFSPTPLDALGYALANLTICAFVVFVFLRNYFVMHGIDSRHDRVHNEFPFVDGNTGWADRIERVLRAAIVFMVVATPKDIIKPISDVVSGFALFMVTQVDALLNRFAPHPAPDLANEALTQLFPYYGALLVGLFILFFLWDFTNVLTWAGGRGAPRESVEDIRDIDTNSTLYWLLRYFALIAPVDGSPDGELAYDDAVVGRRAAQTFSRGAMLRFYFASPKFRERVMGLIASVMIFVVAATNYSLAAATGFVLSVAGYYVFACKNRRGIRHLAIELVQFPCAYLLSRPQERVNP